MADRVALVGVAAALGAGVALVAVAATLGLTQRAAPAPIVVMQPPRSSSPPGSPPRRRAPPRFPGAMPAPEPSSAAFGPSLPGPVATRGPSPGYEQVGVLTMRGEDTSQSAPTILPLYGKPTYSGSSKWLYFTSNDKFHVMKLPVESERGRACSKEYGCDQIMEGETVTVPQYRAQFDVTLYNVGFGYDPTDI